MTLIGYALACAGGLLSVIAVLDGSWRAAGIAVVLFASAYAVQRRLALFWWIGCLFLLVCFGQAARDIFRGPRTPLAVMCSVLAMLCTLWISSWWSRQRHHFSRGRAVRRDMPVP